MLELLAIAVGLGGFVFGLFYVIGKLLEDKPPCKHVLMPGEKVCMKCKADLTDEGTPPEAGHIIETNIKAVATQLASAEQE